MTGSNTTTTAGGTASAADESNLISNAMESENGPAAELAGAAGSLQDRISSGDWDMAAMIADGQAANAALMGVLEDPLGALTQAGVGFVLDHVSFLREPLEVLTGAPDQVMAVAENFIGFQRDVDQASADFADTMNAMPTWEGPTAEAYQRLGSVISDGLQSTSTVAGKVAEGIESAARMVAQVKDIVYQAISDFVQRAVEKAVAALASSWATFGGSVAAATAAIAADAAQLAMRFSQRLTKLLDAAAQFVEIYRSLTEGITGVAEAMELIAAMREQQPAPAPVPTAA